MKYFLKIFIIIITAIIMFSVAVPAGIASSDENGTVVIEQGNYPSGAEVWIDGVLYEQSAAPCTLSLEAGTYEVQLVIPGYETYSDEVTVSAGAASTISDVVMLPQLAAEATVITVNSSADEALSESDTSITVESLSGLETITLRRALYAVMNDAASTHYRIEFTQDITDIYLSTAIDISRRGNLTVNGDTDRDGTPDVQMHKAAGFSHGWYGCINVLTSNTYIIGLKFINEGTAKERYFTVQTLITKQAALNIENLYVLGCYFEDTWWLGLDNSGVYGDAAESYGGEGSVTISNLVYSGNSFDNSQLFTLLAGGDEDYNILDGYQIYANSFLNCGVTIVTADANTLYIYGNNSYGNGGIAGNAEFSEYNILRNVNISGNSASIDSNSETAWPETFAITCANLGNCDNLTENIVFKNNVSEISETTGTEYASAAITNASLGFPENTLTIPFGTSNNILRNVEFKYNQISQGSNRAFRVSNIVVADDLGRTATGDNNLMENISVHDNTFSSPAGVTINNYYGMSWCPSASGNTMRGIYFTDNDVNNRMLETDYGTEGINVSAGRISNNYGSETTADPDYSGTMENIYINDNAVNDYRYGIVLAGSAGDYVDALGIDTVEVKNNTIVNNDNKIHEWSEGRYGIVVSGAAFGTGGSDPLQPGSTNCFVKNADISGNTVTARGGIAVTGGYYEGERGIGVGGNYVENISVADNTFNIQQEDGMLSVPSVLCCSVADIWNSVLNSDIDITGNRLIEVSLTGNTINDPLENSADYSSFDMTVYTDTTLTDQEILDLIGSYVNRTSDGYPMYEFSFYNETFDKTTPGRYLAIGTASGGYIASIAVELEVEEPPPPVLVSEVTVTSTSDTVTKTETLQMSATVLPEDADDKSYTWSVENGTGGASISTDGLLTGTEVGTVTVRATANDASGVSGIKEITVTPLSVSSIEVTSDADTVRAGQTLQMNASVMPQAADNKGVEWSVENGTGQAEINAEGLLAGVSTGTVTVKAAAKDGSEVVGSKDITVTHQALEDQVVGGKLKRTYYDEEGNIEKIEEYYGADDSSVIQKISYYTDVRTSYELFDTDGNMTNLVELYSDGNIKKVNYYNTGTGYRYAYKLYDTAGRMTHYIYTYSDGIKPKKTSYYNASTGKRYAYKLYDTAGRTTHYIFTYNDGVKPKKTNYYNVNTGIRKYYKLYDTQGRATHYAECYSDGVKAKKMNYYNPATGVRTAYKTYREDGSCSCYVKCDSSGQPYKAMYYDEDGDVTKVVYY